MCTITVIAVVLSALLLSIVSYRRLYSQMTAGTRNEAGYVAAAVEAAGEDYLARLAPTGGVRVSWIAADGRVLYDSAEAPERMGNHAGRTEVRQALVSGIGEDARLSGTLGKKTYYYALRLEDGTVIRLANTIDSVYATLLQSAVPTVAAVIAVVLAAAYLSRRQTGRILKPLDSLDLEDPAANETAYDELAPILRRMAGQNRKIREQMEVLQRQQDELASITANMREGLIVLDGSAGVLSLNRSARALLAAGEEDCLGKSVFGYCRDRTFLTAVERALAGESADGVLQLHGRTFRLIASPAERGAGGAILLLIDVTESYSAEQLRREFSANVSHELKTPLTSISGYAELIQNGMVRPEDVPAFAGRIYQEANRLIALVQDIIKISRLDEGAEELSFQPVELLPLARSAALRLQRQAEERQVTLTVEGKGCTVQGAAGLLDEMIYNLVENAVRYNRPGGFVKVTAEERQGCGVLTVEDSGIGIPEADRERVFERFYRVDPGRSKQSGGTGLGLSIVKHAAQRHGAEVTLRSTEGEGTAVTVTFPAK